eukprot:gene42141-57066_t
MATMALALMLAVSPGGAAETPPTGASVANAPPPAELFARLPFILDPTLSPDGTKIAAQLAINGELRFAIAPLGDPSHIRLINPGPADINGWDWVNNDWLIVRLGQSSAVEGDT